MWSRAALAALLALPGTAWAGACCVGATSGVPLRLGECETWLVGLGLGAEAAVGRWDADARPAPSSLDERAGVGTAAVAWRWSRRGQVGLSLPGRVQRREAGTRAGVGAGPGDLRVQALLQPVAEVAGGRPGVDLGLGLRAPTGRSWSESQDPLLADVTGLPGPALGLGVGLQRSLGAWPGSLALDAELPLGASPLGLSLSGGVGRTVGPSWTVLGTGRASASVDGGVAAWSTLVGARVVRGERLRWRAWAGAELPVALPGLGRDQPQLGNVGVGLLRVR